MLTLLKKLSARNASIVINGDPADFDAAYLADLKVKAEEKGYDMRIAYNVTDTNCTTTISVRRKADK